MSKILVKLFVVLISIHKCFAVIANPNPFYENQIDGSKIQLYVKGDENHSWLEDGYGFYVSREITPSLASDGSNSSIKIVYNNITDSGEIVSTNYLVGSVNPYDLNLKIPKISEYRRHRRRHIDDPRQIVQQTVGEFNVLIVMIKWSDCNYKLPNNTDLDILYNSNNHSVKDLYSRMSYGKLIMNTTFTDWINVSISESIAAQGMCYGCSFHNSLIEALIKIDNMFNLNNFGAIGFIHSGVAAEFNGDRTNYIWSHQWSIPTWTSKTSKQVTNYFITSVFWGTNKNEIARIGTSAHEFGHFLGLPDLYDIDGDGSGLGKYSLMANSWGFDGSQNYPGFMDAWCRIKLGWGNVIKIDKAGNYSIQYVGNSPNIYKISTGFPNGEYLLVENRQPVDYDKTLPSGGLAIYHIDESTTYPYLQGYPTQNGWPSNGKHYKIALLQADGLYELERLINQGNIGDFYHSDAQLNANTIPNTQAYQNGIVSNTGINIIVPSIPSDNMYFIVDLPQCFDGIKNGDEMMIDCGGLYCKSCETTTLTVSAPPTTITLPTTITVPTTVTTFYTFTNTATVTDYTTITIYPVPLSIKKITLTQPKVGTTFTGVVTISLVDDKGNIVNGAIVTGYFINIQTMYKVKGGNRIQCTSNWKLYNPNLIFCISTVTKIGYTFQKNTCIKMSKI